MLVHSKLSLKEVNTFELGVVTFRTLKPEEDHPCEQQECNIRATFRTLEPEDPTVATVHPFEQQEVQVIASPGAPLFKLRQSLESGALEGSESTPHSTQGYSGGYLKPSVCGEWLS